MVNDFYIFRHGQSTYNLAGRTQGQTNDSVLTPLGEEQALEVGKKLADRNIEVIVSSPLQRALQTADLANKSLNVPIVIDKHFIEVNVGVVEGMHYTDILKQYKDIFEKLHSPNIEDCFDVCYPQGETKRQVQERMWQGLQNWCNCREGYHTIAISSHGIALAQIMNALGQYTQDIKNGAILHISEDKGTWKIVEII